MSATTDISPCNVGKCVALPLADGKDLSNSIASLFNLLCNGFKYLEIHIQYHIEWRIW